MGNGSPTCDDRRTDIDVQQRVDVFQRELREVVIFEYPRIVDEDVESAQLGNREPEGPESQSLEPVSEVVRCQLFPVP